MHKGHFADFIQVVIVDEFTGRTLPGRRWGDGLHQAIEAKEGLDIQNETTTEASISYQVPLRCIAAPVKKTHRENQPTLLCELLSGMAITFHMQWHTSLRQDQVPYGVACTFERLQKHT